MKKQKTKKEKPRKPGAFLLNTTQTTIKEDLAKDQFALSIKRIIHENYNNSKEFYNKF